MTQPQAPEMTGPTPTGAWTPDGEKIAVPGETAVLDAICTVFDPEIPVNIYELGLIYTVDISDEGDIHVEMTLTAPGCPSAQELPEMVREAVARVPGTRTITVDTVWEPAWHPGRMSEEARLSLNMY